MRRSGRDVRGEIVESGATRDVFLKPRHPYTRKLLECDPARIEKATRTLPVIAGKLPDLVDLPRRLCIQNALRCVHRTMRE